MCDRDSEIPTKTKFLVETRSHAETVFHAEMRPHTEVESPDK